jgi:hypothetical protein
LYSYPRCNAVPKGGFCTVSTFELTWRQRRSALTGGRRMKRSGMGARWAVRYAVGSQVERLVRPAGAGAAHLAPQCDCRQRKFGVSRLVRGYSNLLVVRPNVFGGAPAPLHGGGGWMAAGHSASPGHALRRALAEGRRGVGTCPKRWDKLTSRDASARRIDRLAKYFQSGPNV